MTDTHRGWMVQLLIALLVLVFLTAVRVGAVTYNDLFKTPDEWGAAEMAGFPPMPNRNPYNGLSVRCGRLRWRQRGLGEYRRVNCEAIATYLPTRCWHNMDAREGVGADGEPVWVWNLSELVAKHWTECEVINAHGCRCERE
jgi:hypothetical protein